ncbi:hypothetical protein D0Z00_003536 [Geotrichum galactomycetum]|uniref:Uncharacterized protein n=1 Tax=Geotrichum galactomycetum TaxID=27317 RepID=A0ACB6V0X5_9ASCO|nr:hypothetical protein D0Z00_003536 [Geotrichum candidum]
MTTSSLLSVGCSPASAFLAWRLQQQHQEPLAISVIWTDQPGISTGSAKLPTSASTTPVSASYTIKSAKFSGSPDSSNVFTPTVTYYNPAQPNAFAAPFDYVLISQASLKSLAATPRALLAAGAVQPGHTLILVDAAYSVGLHDLLAKRFPDNPVCAIATAANVRLAPPANAPVLTGQKDDTLMAATALSSSPLLLLHTGDDTTTTLSPLLQHFAGNAGFSQRQSALVRALNAAGVAARVVADYDQEQWHAALPFVALQPLAVLLEAATPAALLNDVLAKPLYSGIASEMAAIARRHAGVNLSQDYLTNALAQFSAQNPPSQQQQLQPNQKAVFTISTSSSSSSSSSLTYAAGANMNPTHADAPVLFYNFFHGLPVPADTLLLQLILLADEHGIRTPYIESTFAYLSRLLVCNAGQSAVLGRVALMKQSAAAESSLGIAPLSNSVTAAGASGQGINLDLDVERRELNKRRRELDERENTLALREQKLNQLSVTLKKQQYQHHQQIQQQQQQQPPLLSQAQMAQSRSNSFGRQRPASMTQSLAAGAPIMESPAEQQIDMMYITNRRNRRSISSASLNGPNGRTRLSSSAASLAALNGGNTGLSSYALGPPPKTLADRERMFGEAESITSPHMAPAATFSFTNGGGGGVPQARSRYGMVDSMEISRSSRANSLSSTRSGMVPGRGSQMHSSPALFTEHFGGPTGTYNNNNNDNNNNNNNNNNGAPMSKPHNGNSNFVTANGGSGMFSGFSGVATAPGTPGYAPGGMSRRNSAAGYYPPPAAGQQGQQQQQQYQQQRRNSNVQSAGEKDYEFQNPYTSSMYQ